MTKRSDSIYYNIPKPKCICFYNGKKEQPERSVLNLSDAYEGEGDIEVKVTMLNINYGMNRKLMDACKPLKEYAWIVDRIRCFQNEKMNLDSAVDKAIDEMPDDFSIKKFLVGNRAEVKMRFLTEYNEEKVLEQERKEAYEEAYEDAYEEAYEEAYKEAHADAREERNEEVAKDMLMEGDTLNKVKRISRLSEEKIIQLAKELGVKLV